MGTLTLTIRERMELARAKQAEVPTVNVAAEQAEHRRRTAEFDKTNVLCRGLRPRCRWCGTPLRLFRWRANYENRVYGDYGDNLFCGLRCGYEYGKYRAKGFK